MPIASINGSELFYETAGAGPALLMLHGNGLDHSYLRPWHDALADRFRVIYYDQRWHGRSARQGPIDHATFHADAIALLDHLGEARATVYGQSYGSWLALGLAARHPDRVERLVLCGTSPVFDHAEQAVATALARHPEAAAALIGGLQHGVASDDALRELWAAILPLYFHGPSRPEVLANVRFSAPGFQDLMQALAGFSMVDTLASLALPILALVGTDDYITPPSQARRLAALAPNASVVEFSKSGHFPFVEENGPYLDAIRSWSKR
jgi:proline iminopeptidase